MPDEARNSHPFFMYEAMHAQPAEFARVAGEARPLAQKLARQIVTRERVFFVGMGASFHAAVVADYAMRLYGGSIPSLAINSFDFVLYGPKLSSRDAVVVVSHRGSERYGKAALALAQEQGALTALIVGAGTGASGAAAVIETVEPERSIAHSVSVTGAVAALSSLIAEIGSCCGAERRLDPSYLIKEVPAAIKKALSLETAAMELAREHLPRRAFLISGSGPSAVIAREAALKLKETSYAQAEGVPIEEVYHGPFQAVDSEDLVIGVAPTDPGQARTLQLAEPTAAVGAHFLIVTDSPTLVPRTAQSAILEITQLKEPFGAFVSLIPLQLFSYFLALEKGANPDCFRLSDERYRKAVQLFKL